MKTAAKVEKMVQEFLVDDEAAFLSHVLMTCPCRMCKARRTGICLDATCENCDAEHVVVRSDCMGLLVVWCGPCQRRGDARQAIECGFDSLQAYYAATDPQAAR